MILEKFYENPEILHVGTEENRCFYVPLDLQEKENARNLSGIDWKFGYFPYAEAVPEFYKKDFDEEAFGRLEVPSCWQMLGLIKSSIPIYGILSPSTLLLYRMRIPAALISNTLTSAVRRQKRNSSFILKEWIPAFMCG